MTRTALFIIETAPTAGPRGLEGLRLAAGVGAWKKVEPIIYLGQEATGFLTDAVDFPGDDEAAEWLRILSAAGKPFYFDASAKMSPALRADYPVQPVSAAELAALAASANYLLRF